MASTSQCKYCDSVISSDESFCPHCGAPNDNFVVNTKRQVFLPKTMEELKEYCAERGMPLLRMRFFIGEDYRQPKAFGIYRDGENFVVYKNKANGQRAIRYRGPDEAYAVNELFQKLLEECHNRGIYPEGKAAGRSSAGGDVSGKARRSYNRSTLTFIFLILFSFFLLRFIFAFVHRNDGYYGTGNGTVYYHYGNSWYYSSDTDPSDYWSEAYGFPEDDYREYSLGEKWTSDWGVSNFKSSSAWHEIQESHSSSSSDYDSWDSDDTDWDSDW